MNKNNKFTKFIACTVAGCFTYSFILFEPLMGITQGYKESNVARAMSAKIDKFVLPYRFGRVMGGSLAGNSEQEKPDYGRLVVFIQDLHCHPEVQRNISEIENLLEPKILAGQIEKAVELAAPAKKRAFSREFFSLANHKFIRQFTQIHKVIGRINQTTGSGLTKCYHFDLFATTFL